MIGISRATLSYRSQDIVVQRLFVVIHVLGVLVEHEQLPAELQQIVSRAGFVLAARREAVGEQGIGLRGKTFGVMPSASHAADAVGIRLIADIPEMIGDQIIFDAVRVAIRFQRASDLRNVLVRMTSAQGIDVLGEPMSVLGVAVEEIDVIE